MAPAVAYLDWLEQSVAAALGEGSVGEPVSVRLFLALSEDHGELTRNAAAGVAAAGRWFRQPLERLFAQGSVEQGQISALASFAGRTAIVSAELVRPGGHAEIRLLALGQKGSLAYQDAPGADGIRVDLRPPEAPLETELIEGSLRDGFPRER
jgi:hypothetical protein